MTTADYLSDLVLQRDRMAAAIREKGIEITADAKFNEFAEKITAVYDKGKADCFGDFWDKFQKLGLRTDYSYAFFNWTHSEIAPKYSISAEKIMYMFMNCGEVTDLSNITVNITASLPNMMYGLANCVRLTKPPQFVITAPIVKTYTSLYANCAAMTECRVYWGDGSKDPVTQRNSCQNTFFNCKNLVNIDFCNAETGSPIYLDLSWCTNLNRESVQSLLSSLQTIPDGSAGTYSITLSEATYTAMSEETSQGFTTKGWTIVSKNRE